MSTDTSTTQTTREVIVNPPNRKLFPNALPHDNAPMDTTLITNRFWGPIETNDMVAAAIAAGAKKREEAEIFIDRREPVSLRRTYEAIQGCEGREKGKLEAVKQKQAAAKAQIAQLLKIQKQYAKQKTNRFAIDAHKELQTRVVALEERLVELKEKERQVTANIRQAAQSLKDFLAARPRKHLPSNEELLSEYAEAQRLEDEFRRVAQGASF